jgi:hypothetical protein
MQLGQQRDLVLVVQIGKQVSLVGGPQRLDDGHRTPQVVTLESGAHLRHDIVEERSFH